MKATTGFLRRIVLAAAAAAAVLPLLPATAEARPGNPGDREISAAQRDRAGKATEVGRLSGLLARANGDLRRASDRAELAVERYNKAVVDLTSATDRSTTAKAQVAAARRGVPLHGPPTGGLGGRSNDPRCSRPGAGGGVRRRAAEPWTPR